VDTLDYHFSTTRTGSTNETKQVLSRTRKIYKIKDLTIFPDLILKNKTGSMSSGTKSFIKYENGVHNNNKKG
jgi:hypothetical protein